MKNIRAIILDKYKDEDQFEKLTNYIYKERKTSSYRIALRFELEPNENNQFPLEDLLDKYLLNLTEHSREFSHEGKRILEVELESPHDSGGISNVSEVIGKRVYNQDNGETVGLIIENDAHYVHSLTPIPKWDISAEIEKLRNDKFTPRDNFKSKAYYINELVRDNDFLSKIAENYETGKLSKDVGYYYAQVRRRLIDIIHLFQVLNADKAIIKNYVYEYFSLLKKEDVLHWSYSQEVIVLALAYLYDIDAEEITWVKSKMPQIKDKYVDAVLDVMRNVTFEDFLDTDKEFYFRESGIFSEPRKAQGGLVDVFKAFDLDTRIEKFNHYLTTVKEKHYKTLIKHHYEVGEERNAYYGSESFKLTALARMLGIRKIETKIANSRFIIEDFLWGENGENAKNIRNRLKKREQSTAKEEGSKVEASPKTATVTAKEHKAKIKELDKALMKIVRQHMKPYGFKTKSNCIWVVQNNFFFYMVLFMGRSDDEHQLNVKIYAKPMYVDDLLWELLNMSSNKNEPLSLRANGAFTVFGVPVVDDDLKLESLEMEDFELLIKDALKKLDSLLRKIKGNEETWFYAEEKKHNSYFQDDALRLMILLHFEKYEETMDYINNSDNDNGGFQDGNDSLYDRVMAYCKAKAKKKPFWEKLFENK